jgi:riboflavin biosynthesis pyrimidine reductase
MIRQVMIASEAHHARTVNRAHPGPPAPVTVLEAYDVERSPHRDGRAWLGLCMVASLDGSTVVHGRSKALSSEDDAAVFLTLRDLADVLLVGASTVRAEGYGIPRKPGQRIGVVTSRGFVDTASPLFASGAGFLVTTEDAPATDVDAVRAGLGRVDLAGALRAITSLVPGARFVQAEGGPRLNASLAAADVIDELDLTLSPQVVGGHGPRIAVGAPDVSAGFDLAHLLVGQGGFVFSRWVRRR